MKLPAIVSLLAAVSAISAITAFPEALDADLVIRSESELVERTFGKNWCFSLPSFGLSIGNCGCWTQKKWDAYKSICSKFGLKVQVKQFGKVLKYKWGNEWIADVDWAFFGKHWLPKDCNKWQFECPDAVVPKPSCPQSWIDGYRKSCKKAGHAPHMWWDSEKNGYWFWFNGKFTFQLDFELTKSGYCVPKKETCNC